MITGGSAGGYTVLAALTFHEYFRGGASHYGVSDLAILAQDTHKFESRYLEITVNPEKAAAARELKPIHERQVFGRSVMLFDRVDRQQLAAYGDVRSPSIADLFVAVMGDQAGAAQGAA